MLINCAFVGSLYKQKICHYKLR